jgi:Zn-dependent protease
MLDLMFNDFRFFLVYIAILLVSLSVHEFAHAFTADRLGDPTARVNGRLSLNPLVHIDPVGMLFILIFGFGWGKPVPYDPYNLKDPEEDAAKIALSGPVSSIALALIGALLFNFVNISYLTNIFRFIVVLNVYLGIFNLMPIHPLDGFQVVAGILPKSQRIEWLSLRRFGMFILLMFMLPIVNGQSPLFILISPVVKLLLDLFIGGGSVI